ncbi:MAG TPA: hypothetical protein VF995_11100 [Actinomycetota bacterium]
MAEPESVGQRVLRALNPRRLPTRARTWRAAAAFAALAVVLGALGFWVNHSYLQPATLTAILAVLWGVRAALVR